MTSTPLKLSLSPSNAESTSLVNWSNLPTSPKNLPTSPLSFLQKSYIPLNMVSPSKFDKRMSQIVPFYSLANLKETKIPDSNNRKGKIVKTLAAVRDSHSKKSPFADLSSNNKRSISLRKNVLANEIASLSLEKQRSRQNSKHAIKGMKQLDSRENTPPRINSPFKLNNLGDSHSPQRSTETSPSNRNASKKHAVSGRSRFGKGNVGDKMSGLKETLKNNKEQNKRVLGNVIRRKSCICSDCGGISAFEKKHLNIAIPPKRSMRFKERDSLKKSSPIITAKISQMVSPLLNTPNSEKHERTLLSPCEQNISIINKDLSEHQDLVIEKFELPEKEEKVNEPRLSVKMECVKDLTNQSADPLKKNEPKRKKYGKTVMNQTNLDNLKRTENAMPAEELKIPQQANFDGKYYSHAYIGPNKSMSSLQENIENPSLEKLSRRSSKIDKTHEDGHKTIPSMITEPYETKLNSLQEVKYAFMKDKEGSMNKEIEKPRETQGPKLDDLIKIIEQNSRTASKKTTGAAGDRDNKDKTVKDIRKSKLKLSATGLQNIQDLTQELGSSFEDNSKSMTKSHVNTRKKRTKGPEIQGIRLPSLSSREDSLRSYRTKTTESFNDPYGMMSLSMRSPLGLTQRKNKINLSQERQNTQEDSSSSTLSPIRLILGKIVIEGPLLSNRGIRPKDFGVVPPKEIKKEETERPRHAKKNSRVIKTKQTDKSELNKLLERYSPQKNYNELKKRS